MLRRQLLKDGLVGLAIAAIIATTTGVALASHSIPDRLQFWDADRNHYPDLAPEPVRVGGTGWWDNARARVTGAVNAWNGSTNWNVTLRNEHTNYIFIDRPPDCVRNSSGQPYWPGGVVGRACTYVRSNGSYDELYDGDVYISVLNCTSCTWWGGAAKAPNGSWYDLGGFLTHELGHLVRLEDISAGSSVCSSETAYYTMCGSFGPADPPFPPSFTLSDSYYYRTLAQDDVDSANAVYLQVYR